MLTVWVLRHHAKFGHAVVENIAGGQLSRRVTFSRNKIIQGRVPGRGDGQRKDFWYQCVVTHLFLECGSSGNLCFVKLWAPQVPAARVGVGLTYLAPLAYS